MEIHFKEIVQESLKFDRSLSLLSNDRIPVENPSNMEIAQFRLDVQNCLVAGNENLNFFLTKIFNNLSCSKYPENYVIIFDELLFFDFLINIIYSKENSTEQKTFAAAIIANCVIEYRRIFFNFEKLFDHDSFFEILHSPDPFLINVFNHLVGNHLLYSNQIYSEFQQNKILPKFIDRFLKDDDIASTSNWGPLISILASDKLSSDIEDIVLIYQACVKLLELECYDDYLNALLYIFTNENIDLEQYFYSLDIVNIILSNAVKILAEFEMHKEMPKIRRRKKCLNLMRQLVLRDKYSMVNLTFIPIDICARLMLNVDDSDREASLQILNIYLQRVGSKAIEEYINKGIYCSLVVNGDIPFSTKKEIIKLFLYSLNFADREQIEILYINGVLNVVLNSIDVTNQEIMENLANFFTKFTSEEELIQTYLFPYFSEIQQISQEVSDEFKEIVYFTCSVIQKLIDQSNQFAIIDDF